MRLSTAQIPQQSCEEMEQLDTLRGITHIKRLGPSELDFVSLLRPNLLEISPPISYDVAEVKIWESRIIDCDSVVTAVNHKSLRLVQCTKGATS
jgi:hypothetical protein